MHKTIYTVVELEKLRKCHIVGYPETDIAAWISNPLMFVKVEGRFDESRWVLYPYLGWEGDMSFFTSEEMISSGHIIYTQGEHGDDNNA